MALNLALKFAIIESGTSQTVVAAKAEMHESKLSQIINGHRVASETERKRIAKVLRRPVQELFPEAVAS